MNSYARERTAFGQQLAHYGQIQKYIADSYAEYQAGRAYTYNVAAGETHACVCHARCLHCLHGLR